jgi:hypothetical protein
VDYGVVAPYYKIRILTRVDIHSQNSRLWPLYKSANVGIADGNMSQKTVQALHCLLTCCVFFFLDDDGDFQVADCRFSCTVYYEPNAHMQLR